MPTNDKHVYALISSSITEEVSQHILSNTTTFLALKKLKSLYESPLRTGNYTIVGEAI